MTNTTVTHWKPFTKHPQADEIIKGLETIPDSWALTPVIEKRPYRDGWQNEQPLCKAELYNCILNGETIWSEKKQKIWHGYASGYGLRLGDVSDGLIALDIDGASVQQLLNAIS
ncbi:MAG: bifunctional DNA primase/polymerase, partial [Halothece sp. Uz-M2-17]|nr:bifunctional DNA primase/polymerase [Halothece sp. Uz-M2-17]